MKKFILVIIVAIVIIFGIVEVQKIVKKENKTGRKVIIHLAFKKK